MGDGWLWVTDGIFASGTGLPPLALAALPAMERFDAEVGKARPRQGRRPYGFCFFGLTQISKNVTLLLHFNIYLFKWTRRYESIFIYQGSMEYIPLESFKYYSECEELVNSLGYHLVEFKVTPQKGVVQILAVITADDATVSIGVNDCSKVHKVLLAKVEELLGHDNTYMELTSPGLERNIRNAAEFKFFKGREIRVYSREASDWIGGKLVSADDKCLTLEISQADESKVQKTVQFEDIAKAKFIHL